MQEGPVSSTAAVQKSTESCSCAGYLATEIPSGLSSFAPWSTKAERSVSCSLKIGKTAPKISKLSESSRA